MLVINNYVDSSCFAKILSNIEKHLNPGDNSYQIEEKKSYNTHKRGIFLFLLSSNKNKYAIIGVFHYAMQHISIIIHIHMFCEQIALIWEHSHKSQQNRISLEAVHNNTSCTFSHQIKVINLFLCSEKNIAFLAETSLYKVNTIYFLILLLWTPDCVQYFETFINTHLLLSCRRHSIIHSCNAKQNWRLKFRFSVLNQIKFEF